MKLTTKGKYGIMAMATLANKYIEDEKSLTSIRTIASENDISIAYLERLIAKLRKKDLVITKRGATGGYVLARNPKEIKLLDIYIALEGEVDLCGCNANNSSCNTKCISKHVGDLLNDSISKTLSNITLYDLL